MERAELTPLEGEAFRIAKSAHWGQKDKNGEDYIFHPTRVSKKGKSENERIVGFLHDVIEDTDITLEYLEEAGFSQEILLAIEALTKKKNEPYPEYLARVKENELARTVKLYDIEDNTDPDRLKKLNDQTREERVKEYRYARDFLLSPLPKD